MSGARISDIKKAPVLRQGLHKVGMTVSKADVCRSYLARVEPTRGLRTRPSPPRINIKKAPVSRQGLYKVGMTVSRADVCRSYLARYEPTRVLCTRPSP